VLCYHIIKRERAPTVLKHSFGKENGSNLNKDEKKYT
jgi:hypothetical protein